MRLVARETPFPQRLVLEYVWPALHAMTSETGFVCARQLGTTALNRVAFVRFMTGCAAHFALQYRMVVGQSELGADFKMALETSFRRLLWVDDRVRGTTAFDVQTSGTMTRLTSHLLAVLALCHQPRVGGGMEITRYFAVAGIATV
jgi:hypothetical protein